MKKYRKIFIFTLIVGFPGLHGTVVAQESVPKLINYQGKLTDAAGAALAAGNYSVRFELFDAATEGALVWGEVREVTVVDGLFNVALGGSGSEAVTGAAVNDLSFAFSGSLRFLQTTVMSGPGIVAPQLLLPRQQMGSVPYATNSQNLDGKEPSFWVPSGMISAYGGTADPQGWFVCDGRPLNRTEYSFLFNIIGTRFGAPDGNTFNLPDLRGRFLRGADDPDGGLTEFAAANRDPDRASRVAMNPGSPLTTGNNVGSVQPDQLKSHTHSGSFASATHKHWTTFSLRAGGIEETSNVFGSRTTDNYSGQTHNTNSSWYTAGSRDFVQSSTSEPATGGVGVAASGGLETRPMNAYVNFMIKY